MANVVLRAGVLWLEDVIVQGDTPSLAAYLLSIPRRHRLGGAPSSGWSTLLWSSRLRRAGAQPLPSDRTEDYKALGGGNSTSRTMRLCVAAVAMHDDLFITETPAAARLEER